MPDCRPARSQALVLEHDEVFKHVLDGLRAGIERVDFELFVAHTPRREGVEEFVVFQALRGEKVRVGELVVGGEDEPAGVVPARTGGGDCAR